MNAHIAQLHYLTLESYIYKSPLHVLPNPLEESGPAHSNFIFEFFETHIQCTQVEMAKRQHFLFWFWGYNNWRGSDEVACNLGQIHRKRKHPSVGRPHHLNLKLNPINGCAVVKGHPRKILNNRPMWWPKLFICWVLYTKQLGLLDTTRLSR